jgi:metallophosphoesterase (TIGR00282 family)
VNLLFIGDIVGQPGREAVLRLVPRLRREWALDAVIANGENAAGGSGITPRIAGELLAGGVDVLTLGDHAWDQKELIPHLAREPRILRPLNYPPGAPGRGSGVFHLENHAHFAVVNLQGRAFMADLDNPFLAIEPELARLRAETPVVLVDFHAEATSEKIALGRMIDGQATAVIGTHTHVQTADDQVLPGGTAYLTDAGFTGPHDSVIGRRLEPVLERFRTNLPQRFEIASGRVLLQGACIEADPGSGRARSIRRVSEPMTHAPQNDPWP